MIVVVHVCYYYESYIHHHEDSYIGNYLIKKVQNVLAIYVYSKII